MLQPLACRLVASNRLSLLYSYRFITTAAKRKLKEKKVIKKRGGSAAKARAAHEQTQKTKPPPKQKQGIAHPASLFLGIFPIVATAIVVARNPEMQKQVKANWSSKRPSDSDHINENDSQQSTTTNVVQSDS